MAEKDIYLQQMDIQQDNLLYEEKFKEKEPVYIQIDLNEKT